MLPKEPINPKDAHVLIVEDHIQSAVLLSPPLFLDDPDWAAWADDQVV